MHAIRIVGAGRAGTGRSRAPAHGGTSRLTRGSRDLARPHPGRRRRGDGHARRAVAAVATAVPSEGGIIPAHLSGSLGLDVLARTRGALPLHPLVPLPNAEVGAKRCAAA